MDTIKEEQQARDLLNWDNGIGTLDGCDLRFRINRFGCLELLDSDEEECENQKSLRSISKQHAISSRSSQTNNSSNNNGAPTNGVLKLTTKKARVEPASSASNVANVIAASATKQISPGSSLLRDGPNIKRAKCSTTNTLKKIEQNQNSILLDKLVPRQRLDEIRRSSKIDQWTSEDVEKFVDSIQGCSGSGELFKSQQICGKSLLYLDQRDLLDVINLKLGPAVKIYHAISLLK